MNDTPAPPDPSSRRLLDAFQAYNLLFENGATGLELAEARLRVMLLLEADDVELPPELEIQLRHDSACLLHDTPPL